MANSIAQFETYNKVDDVEESFERLKLFLEVH